MTKQINLSECLKRLSEIADWFDQQQNADIEEGLLKVKEAAVLIKASKQRLEAIENEFQEVKKEIDGDQPDGDSQTKVMPDTEEMVITKKDPTETDDLPF